MSDAIEIVGVSQSEKLCRTIESGIRGEGAGYRLAFGEAQARVRPSNTYSLVRANTNGLLDRARHGIAAAGELHGHPRRSAAVRTHFASAN